MSDENKRNKDILLRKQLTELKEQFEEHLHGEYTLREVLWELGKHYKENLEYMVEKGALWDFNIEGLDKLLEKLDSGGEKCVENGRVDSSNATISKSLRDTNSKPPEPNCDSFGHVYVENECKYCGDIYTGKIRDEPSECLKTCAYCEMKFRTIEDRKQHELTHEDHIIVKREKIEFWRLEMLNKTDEVLKSMREVLGIE